MNNTETTDTTKTAPSADGTMPGPSAGDRPQRSQGAPHESPVGERPERSHGALAEPSVSRTPERWQGARRHESLAGGRPEWSHGALSERSVSGMSQPTVGGLPGAPEGGVSGVRHLNEVHVVGRISAAPEVRPLSGGELVVWRMAVERPRAPGGARRSDWIACTATDPEPRAAVAGLRVGDVLEVRGRLRRRFWRSRNGPVTPLEVEVHGAVALVRAARGADRRTPASPGP